MAPSQPTALAMALAGGAAFAGATLAGTSLRPAAFVAGQAGSIQAPARHLRAGGAGASTPAPGVASAAAAVATCAFLATGAAAARRRGGETARAAAPTAVEMNIPRPEDLLESPKFPMYLGSGDGYFSKSTRERHAITWTAKEEMMFEMPQGNTFAMMNKGENLCYFRKKEQCIALGKQLRQKKIDNYKIYRIKKDGTVIFMHPADGVFPEKVNKGRVQVNGRPFSCGANASMPELKWTKYDKKAYEADPLTTMFVKARMAAWFDNENIFPLPQPNDFTNPEYAEYTKQMQESFDKMPEASEAQKARNQELMDKVAKFEAASGIKSM